MGEITVRVRYFRRVASGYYWEPSRKVRKLGFSAEPLGKDLPTALARARELNRQVDAEVRRDDSPSQAVVVEGSLSWAVAEYQNSEEWKRLAEATKRGYRQGLKRAEQWAGDMQVSRITRKAVKVWYRRMAEEAPAFAAATIRAFRVVMHFAKDEGHQIADLNKLRLHTAGGNSEPWEDYEISAYLDEARRQGRQSMALALMLGVCLGQREGDVLRLPRSAYDAATGMVTLRQGKTGATVAIPALPELKREIALTPARGTIFVISEKSGKGYKARYFARLHRDICKAAGIPDKRWFMHLRHTGATRLGEAGATDEQLRAVTGHKDRAVVGRYVQPSGEMAAAGIAKLLAHRGRKREL